jgi:hypothetical protein
MHLINHDLYQDCYRRCSNHQGVTALEGYFEAYEFDPERPHFNQSLKTHMDFLVTMLGPVL